MNTFRIHRVAKLTGLSKDVIRVWERRYDLVKPSRGANRYRIYSDEDVALLRYIKKEMDKGRSIGELAVVGRDELLVQMLAGKVTAVAVHEPLERLLGQLIAALDPFDRLTFERRLNGALAVIPFEEAIHGILVPLQERVGEMWHEQLVNVATEHYVTRQVQQKIYSVMNQLPIAVHGPKVVVACPPGENHEVGAQTITYLCKAKGCRVYYLGADIPVSSLAGFCTEVQAHLALISITIPLSSESSVKLTRDLVDHVMPICPILAGGAGGVAMRQVLEKEDIEVLEDFVALERRLVKVFASHSNSASERF